MRQQVRAAVRRMFGLSDPPPKNRAERDAQRRAQRAKEAEEWRRIEEEASQRRREEWLLQAETNRAKLEKGEWFL
jgi:hypothetical protein